MTGFFKLSGGGNDFIALAESKEPTARQIAAWCRRGISEGADGLFLLDREDAAVRMRHFNSDGERATLCVNGTRCAARLAFELGWASGTTSVLTDAGPFVAREVGAVDVELELRAPDAAPEPVEIIHDGTPWQGLHLVVGVPHLVILWKRPMSEAPVATVGAALRAAAILGKDGANVDFVDFPAPHRMAIRSFERGVEAETLACGSGVLAATVVGLAKDLVELPLTALTRGGFSIDVGTGRQAEHWSLRGDARLVAEGTLREGAATAPKSPDW